MKLIIDIPDNEYKHIREYYEKNDTVETIYSYICNGTPLDKLRAEMQTLSRADNKYVKVWLSDVLALIDKYRNEVSK